MLLDARIRGEPPTVSVAPWEGHALQVVHESTGRLEGGGGRPRTGRLHGPDGRPGHHLERRGERGPDQYRRLLVRGTT